MIAFFCVAMSILIASCDVTTSTRTNDNTPAIEAKHASQVPGHTPGDPKGSLEEYVDNDLYVIIDADIDMDGTLDKIVSSAQNMGNELIFFKKDGDSYRNVLVSRNLTEDGGRIPGEIKQTAGDLKDDEVISIETFSPKGMDIATQYISYSGDEWNLSRTIYETSDWKNHGNVIYRCEVEQNIPMRDLSSEVGASRIRQLPEELDRDRLCLIGEAS